MSDQTDKRLELAYDAGEKKLALQESTLASVRTRANNLLATAALFTSFSAGVGLINTDRTKGTVLPLSAGIALLVVVILLGISVLYVVLPATNWQFVPSASKIMELYNRGQDEASIRKTVIAAMIKGGKDNQGKLDRRQWAFRIAALLLVCEMAILVWILIVR